MGEFVRKDFDCVRNLKARLDKDSNRAIIGKVGQAIHRLAVLFVADLRLPVNLALLVGVQLLERSPDHSEHIVLERRDQPVFHSHRREARLLVHPQALSGLCEGPRHRVEQGNHALNRINAVEQPLRGRTRKLQIVFEAYVLQGFGAVLLQNVPRHVVQGRV